MGTLKLNLMIEFVKNVQKKSDHARGYATN